MEMLHLMGGFHSLPRANLTEFLFREKSLRMTVSLSNYPNLWSFYVDRVVSLFPNPTLCSVHVHIWNIISLDGSRSIP